LEEPCPVLLGLSSLTRSLTTSSAPRARDLADLPRALWPRDDARLPPAAAPPAPAQTHSRSTIVRRVKLDPHRPNPGERHTRARCTPSRRPRRSRRSRRRRPQTNRHRAPPKRHGGACERCLCTATPPRCSAARTGTAGARCLAAAAPRHPHHGSCVYLPLSVSPRVKTCDIPHATVQFSPLPVVYEGGSHKKAKRARRVGSRGKRAYRGPSPRKCNLCISRQCNAHCVSML
jgi:hypothetical protein